MRAGRQLQARHTHAALAAHAPMMSKRGQFSASLLTLQKCLPSFLLTRARHAHDIRMRGHIISALSPAGRLSAAVTFRRHDAEILYAIGLRPRRQQAFHTRAKRQLMILFPCLDAIAISGSISQACGRRASPPRPAISRLRAEQAAPRMVYRMYNTEKRARDAH